MVMMMRIKMQWNPDLTKLCYYNLIFLDNFLRCSASLCRGASVQIKVNKIYKVARIAEN